MCSSQFVITLTKNLKKKNVVRESCFLVKIYPISYPGNYFFLAVKEYVRKQRDGMFDY